MLHTKETRISFGHLGLWLMCSFTFLPGYRVQAGCGFALGIACKQALWGALVVGWGKRKESFQQGLWNLNSTSNSHVAPCWLSCQFSANPREAEMSATLLYNCFLKPPFTTQFFTPFSLGLIVFFGLAIILSVPSTYHFPFSDHFINSHNFSSWLCIDIVRRKLMLITLGTWKVE